MVVAEDGKTQPFEQPIKKLERIAKELAVHQAEHAATTDQATEDRIKKLEDEVKKLEEHEAQEHKLKETRIQEQNKDSVVRKSGSGGLVYARPGYSNPRAVLGGYIGSEFEGLKGPTNVRRNRNNSFDVPRFVALLYSDITDSTRVAVEFEVEHGIGHAELEFAVIDHSFTEWLNFRTGVVLLPVGSFNLLHDDPLNDLTQRPEVNIRVIPGVLREPGAGFFGTVYPTKLSKLDYEVYVTQGMNGFKLDGTPTITNQSGLAGARWQTTDIGSNLDNNNSQALVGRVAYSPYLGLDLGVSGYHSKIDPDDERTLNIAALDWSMQRGPFEFLGEAAWSWMEDNDKDLDGLFVGNPERMFGYYAQINYHFMPDFIQEMAPSYFTDDSMFTGVFRVDDVNTNLDMVGHEGDTFRLTPGINYRPTEDTVFKFEYQFNFEPNRIGDRQVENNGILLSVASYF